MKASELVRELGLMVAEHGDREVVYYVQEENTYTEYNEEIKGARLEGKHIVLEGEH